MAAAAAAPGKAATLEIIAFHLGDQQFCIRTTSIREIRGWAAATPLPHAPPHVIGVMNLRGTVIPVIDLAQRLGMAGTIDSSRSAIVVAEVDGSILGPIVDRVSDILSIAGGDIQPLPVRRSTNSQAKLTVFLVEQRSATVIPARGRAHARAVNALLRPSRPKSSKSCTFRRPGVVSGS